jgi:hypothetical protein
MARSTIGWQRADTRAGEHVTTPSRPLLCQVFPDFVDELDQLLRAKGRYELADQLRSLEIHGRCGCEEFDCAQFYTVPVPEGPYGSGHQAFQLASASGLIVVDAIVGRLVAVEVLFRPDVKRQLDLWLPGAA